MGVLVAKDSDAYDVEGGLSHMPDMRSPHLHPLRWLGQRDRGFAALRRATRTAIIMPAMFALGDKVIGNPQVATFAAFGSFAMLLLVDFGGPMAERLQAQAALAVTGGVFVCLATLASQTAWLAAVAMAVVGFGVIFAGVVSSVLAGATTSLLLAFILPVSLAAPASAVPDRLAGWAMAAGVALVAIALLWPAPARDRLRGAAAAACRALAARLRAGVAYLLSGMDEQFARDRDHAAAQSDQAVEALRSSFLAMPYRPTGLSTPARTTVRLVDELIWLNSIVIQPGLHRDGINRAALRVREAAAAVLGRAADLLDSRGGSSDELDAALTELAAAHAKLQEGVTADLPVRSLRPVSGPAAGGEPAVEFITSLDPAFRAEELSYAVSLIARTAELTAAAERRSWRERWLGRQPEGVPGTLSAARERITSYLEPHSVWLHNSLRGAAGLGLAVLVARLTGVQHSFWVVLGALSVLRSNALNTGQDAVRAMLGTVAGFIVGAALLVGDRHEHQAAVVPAAARGLSRRGRPSGHLVRRGAGGVHARFGDLVQHHPADRMARRPGADRRRCHRGWREPDRGCPVLAAGRGARAPSGAGGGVRRRRGLPRQHGAIRDVTRRPRHARIPRLWPATLPGPPRHRAGSMTRSARTWPSAARNGSRLPMRPGWSPGSSDCAWRLTRYWTCGEATTAKRAATWPPHAMRFWAPLNASRAGTTVSRPP